MTSECNCDHCKAHHAVEADLSRRIQLAVEALRLIEGYLLDYDNGPLTSRGIADIAINARRALTL